MKKPVYPSGMSRVERRKLRDEYAAFLMSRKQEGRPVQVKVVERVIVETVKPDLSDTLAKMEAAAARAAQPGVNIPERIKEFADENLTPAQNREAMLKRLSDLGNLIQMGLGTTENKAEYAAYNASMDWLRGA